MKVFQSTVSFLTQQSFKLKITTANAQFLVPAVMNKTCYLDSFWLQAIMVCHFRIGLPPSPLPLKADTHKGFCSWSMLREQSSSVCTNDFMGTLHPREQNFHPAKCSMIFNWLNIGSKLLGQIERT